MMVNQHGYEVAHRTGNLLASNDGIQHASLLLRRNRRRVPNLAQRLALSHKLRDRLGFIQRLSGIDTLIENDVGESARVNVRDGGHALSSILVRFWTGSVRSRELIGEVAHQHLVSR